MILKLLSILTTKGNVDCVVEYFGPGVRTLDRAAAGDDYQYGSGVGRHDQHFPQRRSDAGIS